MRDSPLRTNRISAFDLAHTYSLLESVHLSALIGCQWQSLARIGELAIPGNRRYWIASKSRLERWSSWAQYFESTKHTYREPNQLRWNQLQSYFHEIFATEMVTRLWGAVAVVIDRTNCIRELDSYANSAFLGHLDARQRCLRMLANGEGITGDQISQLDTIRRRAERWTDLLLSHMANDVDVERWAFDTERVADFSLSTSSARDPEVMGTLILASLQSSLLSNESIRALHPKLNRRVVESLLGVFGSDLIDATGSFRAIWQSRLYHRASDVHSLLVDLVNSDEL